MLYPPPSHYFATFDADQRWAFPPCFRGQVKKQFFLFLQCRASSLSSYSRLSTDRWLSKSRLRSRGTFTVEHSIRL